MRISGASCPPANLVICGADELKIRRHCRFGTSDPQWRTIHTLWDQAPGQAVQSLPEMRFADVEDRQV